MRILREAYTKDELKQHVSDTRNIISALQDSLAILQSSFSDPDESLDKEECSKLARYARGYEIDIDDMMNDFYDDFEKFIVDEPEEEEEEIDDYEYETDIEESLRTNGSVKDFFDSMQGKTKREAEKVVAKAKGNPNAVEAYNHYLETLKESVEVSFCPKCGEHKNINFTDNLSTIKCDTCGYEGPQVDYMIDGRFTVSDAVNKIRKNNSLTEEFHRGTIRIKLNKDAKSFKRDVEKLDNLVKSYVRTHQAEKGRLAFSDMYTIIICDDTEQGLKQVAKDVMWYVVRYLDSFEDFHNDSILEEDTEKNSKGKWVNKGDTGETHGEFKTKKEADAQRKAMFANGYKG